MLFGIFGKLQPTWIIDSFKYVSWQWRERWSDTNRATFLFEESYWIFVVRFCSEFLSDIPPLICSFINRVTSCLSVHQILFSTHTISSHDNMSMTHPRAFLQCAPSSTMIAQLISGVCSLVHRHRGESSKIKSVNRHPVSTYRMLYSKVTRNSLQLNLKLLIIGQI